MKQMLKLANGSYASCCRCDCCLAVCGIQTVPSTQNPAPNQVVELVKFQRMETLKDVLTSLDTCIANGDEGIILKAWESPYVPAERKVKWMKLKADHISGMGDTLDLLVSGEGGGGGSACATCQCTLRTPRPALRGGRCSTADGGLGGGGDATGATGQAGGPVNRPRLRSEGPLSHHVPRGSVGDERPSPKPAAHLHHMKPPPPPPHRTHRVPETVSCSPDSFDGSPQGSGPGMYKGGGSRSAIFRNFASFRHFSQFRYFSQFPAILPQSPFARPPRVRVGALQLALSTSHLLSVAYRLLLPAGQTCRGLE